MEIIKQDGSNHVLPGGNSTTRPGNAAIIGSLHFPGTKTQSLPPTSVTKSLPYNLSASNRAAGSGEFIQGILATRACFGDRQGLVVMKNHCLEIYIKTVETHEQLPEWKSKYLYYFYQIAKLYHRA